MIILGQNQFSWKIGTTQFVDFTIIYYCAKNQGKLMRKTLKSPASSIVFMDINLIDFIQLILSFKSQLLTLSFLSPQKQKKSKTTVTKTTSMNLRCIIKVSIT